MNETADIIARQILDVMPPIMHMIRVEMRSQRTPDLTVPQFRGLLFINRNPGTSLLALAEHLGLTSPTVCKMVDGLVENRLVSRVASQADRRKVILTLTVSGKALLEMARDGTLNSLERVLSPLTSDEREIVSQALQLLQPLFTQRVDHGNVAMTEGQRV
jgi:DNA-binding MarR family transcriptional regulator